MKVNTKYKLNDKVWRIFENKVIQDVIDGVFVCVDDILKTQTICYNIRGYSKRIDEQKLYPSKEELLKTL